VPGQINTSGLRVSIQTGHAVLPFTSVAQMVKDEGPLPVGVPVIARRMNRTLTPDGGTSRYISGFSCEKGTVESEDAMLALTKERKQLMKKFPNLVDYESKQVYRHFYDSEPMPEATQIIDDIKVEKTMIGVKKSVIKRNFERSSNEKWEYRRRIRVGIPKVLNIWTLAPFLRTCFVHGFISCANEWPRAWQSKCQSARAAST